MTLFPSFFGFALTLNVVFTFRSSDYYKRWKKDHGGIDADTGGGDAFNDTVKSKHANLLKRYLFVYLMATLSDWLQGPYVYALYSDYGFSQHEIAQLFVAGFGSSMVFGSFIGGMADWGGRRKFVILFALIYAASCMTKHFNDYGILMLGRLLGGVATSLLFSVFDAWLIRSHADEDLPKAFLSKSFSWAAYGNSIIAILAGLVANKCANLFEMNKVSDSYSIHFGGFLNPFDLALLALILCGGGAFFLWGENYGDSGSSCSDSDDGNKTHKSKWNDGLKNALTTTLRNRDIFLCGIISSLFEGSMYCFVFMWTPLLKALATEGEGGDLPFGLIFSTFMVCCMAGSSLFSILVDKDIPIEKLAIAVFGVGSFAMALVATGSSQFLSFFGMNLFEMCVGMYFPIMGTMKGVIVPEDKRAAIYNLYRIPLNFIVLMALLTDLKPTISFVINATMLACATGLQTILAKRRLDGVQVEEASKDETAGLV